MRIVLFFIFSAFLFAKVEVLQVLNLDDIKFKNVPFREVSGAVYDKKSNILYMVSDKGYLYRFTATFDKKVKLKPLDAFYLRRESGKRLKKRDRGRDSEDITLKGNYLYISFEGTPKIYKFTKSGIKLKKLRVPRYLKKAKLRSLNKSLEALAYNPKYGFLTALEFPPKGVKKSNQTIYSLSGKKWRYKTNSVKNSAITALESIDNDRVLVLERAYSGLFSRMAITLQELNLKSGIQHKIWEFDSSSDLIENYEALAKVGNNRYIIISDDNNNFFQKTMLIYFRIK